MDWTNAGVISATARPVTFWLNTRKNTRSISLVRSKSQWNTRPFMVPALLLLNSMAVRRLVCTSCTPLTRAVAPLGVVAAAAYRVAPESTWEARSSRRSGS